MFVDRTFEETRVGEKFLHAITVTETHLVLASAIFADFNPLHVDERFAKRSMFGGRIAPGPLTAGIMAGVLGNYFGGTAMALLEHKTVFKAPVKPGDTLYTEWEVQGKAWKERLQGGIVRLKGVCTNQEGQVVAEAESQLLVR